ncbi:MAG TPA: PDZ domain-containing protein, partial [Nitrospiria bacterium]|nr:PDZ domain-containing protein [Nitrospiria bacterium]
STNPIRERGWIGGTYIEAHPSIFKRNYFNDRSGVLQALPAEVKKEQYGAPLVTRVFEGTPLAAAGVHEGDLILKADGAVIDDVKSLMCAIDRSAPGSEVNLVLYRDGKVIERRVTVGKETYERFKTLEFGFGFGLDLDLIPDPDFSIFSLISYHRNDRRVEVRSPEWKFVAINEPGKRVTSATAGPPSEGSPVPIQVWRFWFLIFGVGAQEAVLSQERVDGRVGSILQPMMTIQK